nr:hypothetical protein [uncultured Cellulosilyticum sp.]
MKRKIVLGILRVPLVIVILLAILSIWENGTNWFQLAKLSLVVIVNSVHIKDTIKKEKIEEQVHD